MPLRPWARMFAVLAVFAACGGGRSAVEGVQQPARAEIAEPDGGGATLSQETGATRPTTTVTTLGDAPDAGGVRLPLASASAAAVTPAPSPQSHTHDPGRGPADIRVLVGSHREDARACYDAGLAAHPGLEGDLTVEWTIDPRGKVTRVALDPTRSQILEPAVAACVFEVIRKIQFAPSPGGFETRASFPFNFHPRHPTRPAATSAP